LPEPPTDHFEMDSLTGKVVPVSLDTLLLKDSVAANLLKEITFSDLTIAILSGAIISINGDTTNAQIIAAGTGLAIMDAGGTHTFSIDGTVVTLTGTQSLTNKTLDNTNSIAADAIDSATLDDARLSTNVVLENIGNTYGVFLNNFVSALMRIPLSATPTIAVDGDFAIDTDVTDFSHGIIKYFDGEELGVVSMPIAQFVTPTDGDVIAYNATNDEFELTPGGGGGGVGNFTWGASDEDSQLNTGLLYTTEAAASTITLNSVVISLKNAPTGVSGIEVDILKEDGENDNTFATIFTTRPTIDQNDFTSQTADIQAEIIAATTWDANTRLQLVLTLNDSSFGATGIKVTLT